MTTQEHKHKRIVTDTGITLERRYVYMRPHYFQLLERLAREQDCSISQIIESALDSTKTKDSQNDITSH